MTNISISLGQMNIKLGQVEANFATAEGLIADAAGRGSDLVILPELWTTGYDLENAADYADELNAGSFRAIVRAGRRIPNLHLQFGAGAVQRRRHELRGLLRL